MSSTAYCAAIKKDEKTIDRNLQSDTQDILLSEKRKEDDILCNVLLFIYEWGNTNIYTHKLTCLY